MYLNTFKEKKLMAVAVQDRLTEAEDDLLQTIRPQFSFCKSKSQSNSLLSSLKSLDRIDASETQHSFYFIPSLPAVGRVFPSLLTIDYEILVTAKPNTKLFLDDVLETVIIPSPTPSPLVIPEALDILTSERFLVYKGVVLSQTDFFVAFAAFVIGIFVFSGCLTFGYITRRRRQILRQYLKPAPCGCHCHSVPISVSLPLPYVYIPASPVPAPPQILEPELGQHSEANVSRPSPKTSDCFTLSSGPTLSLTSQDISITEPAFESREGPVTEVETQTTMIAPVDSTIFGNINLAEQTFSKELGAFEIYIPDSVLGGAPIPPSPIPTLPQILEPELGHSSSKMFDCLTFSSGPMLPPTFQDISTAEPDFQSREGPVTEEIEVQTTMIAPVDSTILGDVNLVEQTCSKDPGAFKIYIPESVLGDAPTPPSPIPALPQILELELEQHSEANVSQPSPKMFDCLPLSSDPTLPPTSQDISIVEPAFQSREGPVPEQVETQTTMIAPVDSTIFGDVNLVEQTCSKDPGALKIETETTQKLPWFKIPPRAPRTNSRYNLRPIQPIPVPNYRAIIPDPDSDENEVEQGFKGSSLTRRMQSTSTSVDSCPVPKDADARGLREEVAVIGSSRAAKSGTNKPVQKSVGRKTLNKPRPVGPYAWRN